MGRSAGQVYILMGMMTGTVREFALAARIVTSLTGLRKVITMTLASFSEIKKAKYLMQIRFIVFSFVMCKRYLLLHY